MWFRNLIVYRCPAEAHAASALEAALATRPLAPCGSFDLLSMGWVAPASDERLLYTAHGQHLIALGIDRKLLPAAIVNQVARDRADELEKEQGHPVGRRQMRELKQRVADELRGRALTRRQVTRAWLDPARGWLCVDTASAGRAEEVIAVLRDTLGSFAATRVDAQRSPGSAMTAWLKGGAAPGRFTIGEDLELKALDQGGAAVRYTRHPLDGREIQAHLASGKGASRLELTWHDRLSFVLTDKLELKRLALLDLDRDGGVAAADDAAERFEIDFVLMTGTFGQMLTELIAALGGERLTDEVTRVEVAA